MSKKDNPTAENKLDKVVEPTAENKQETIKSKPATTKNVGGEIVTKEAEDEYMVIWKVNKPVTDEAHKSISNKLKYEEKGTGKKIMLVPFSVDAEIKK